MIHIDNIELSAAHLNRRVYFSEDGIIIRGYLCLITHRGVGIDSDDAKYFFKNFEEVHFEEENESLIS